MFLSIHITGHVVLSGKTAIETQNELRRLLGMTNCHKVEKEIIMSRKILFIILGVCMVLITIAFLAGNAYASTGCFTDTNGNWAEVYICWLKDNGISNGFGDGTYHPGEFVSRDQMAKFLRLQADVPPSKGLIAITPGNTEFVVTNPTSDVEFLHLVNYTVVSKATTGNSYFALSPSITTILYDRRLRLMGIEFCYDATEGAFLDIINIHTYSYNASGGAPILHFWEDVDRTDATCRFYALPAVVILTRDEGVFFTVGVDWTTTSAYFYFKRATFVLMATDNIAVGPAGLTEDATRMTGLP